jgi:hypothetical protein
MMNFKGEMRSPQLRGSPRNDIDVKKILNNSLTKSPTLSVPDSGLLEKKRTPSPTNSGSSNTGKFDSYIEGSPKPSASELFQKAKRRVSSVKNTMIFLSNLKEKTPIEKEFPDVNIPSDMNVSINNIFLNNNLRLLIIKFETRFIFYTNFCLRWQSAYLKRNANLGR